MKPEVRLIIKNLPWTFHDIYHRKTCIIEAYKKYENINHGRSTVDILVKDNVKGREALKWLVLDGVIPILGQFQHFFSNFQKHYLDWHWPRLLVSFYILGHATCYLKVRKDTHLWTTIMVIIGIGTIYLAIIFVSK